MKIARDVIKYVILIGVAVVSIMAALALTFGSLYPFYVVVSASMVPALEIDDMLVVSSRVAFEDIELGDIILFSRPSEHAQISDMGGGGDDPDLIALDNPADRGLVIVHRVVERLEDEPRVLMTQGDANPVPIPAVDFPIVREEYLGKVVYVLPGVGALAKLIHPPVSYALMGIILCCGVAYELHVHPKWRWRMLLLTFRLRDSMYVYMKVIKYDPKSRKARTIFVRQMLKNHFAVVLMGTGLMNQALKSTGSYEDVPAKTLYMYKSMLLSVARAGGVLDMSEDLLDAVLVGEIRSLLSNIESICPESGVGNGYPGYDDIKRRTAYCTERLDSMGDDAILK